MRRGCTNTSARTTTAAPAASAGTKWRRQARARWAWCWGCELLRAALFATMVAFIVSLTTSAWRRARRARASPRSRCLTRTSRRRRSWRPASFSHRRAEPSERLHDALPAFCRVAATLTPSSDSDIKIEVWLPAPRTAGTASCRRSATAAGRAVVSYASLAQAVAAGYAGASTDTGHVGNTAAFAIGHPEKVVDIGYRAVHEMTVKAKADRQRLLRRAREALDLERLLASAAARASPRPSATPRTSTPSSPARPRSTGCACTARGWPSTSARTPARDGYITPDKYPAIHEAMLERVRRARTASKTA